MNLDLPDPLVPAEVDLRNFTFMPLEVLRLRDSDLAALASGDEFRAAVLLWCVAWHQVPAGSLPDEDLLLARFSGAGAAWRKVKAMALRGFVKCSDGRLYHATVCQKAAESWASKQAQRKRTQAATEARGASRKAAVADRDVQRDVSRDVERNAERDVVQGKLREGKVSKGTEDRASASSVQSSDISGTPPPSARSFGEACETEQPPPEGHEPTAAGLAYRAIRAAGIPDANPGAAGLARLLDAGVTADDLAATAAELVAKDTPRFGLLIATVKGRLTDAAKAVAPPSPLLNGLLQRNAERAQPAPLDTAPPP